MPEQAPDVELARIVLDRKGRERVPEAVGMHLRLTGPPSEPARYLLEAVGA